MTKPRKGRVDRRKAAKSPGLGQKNIIDISTATVEELRPIVAHLYTKIQVMTEEAGLLNGLITDLRTERAMDKKIIADLQAAAAPNQ